MYIEKVGRTTRDGERDERAVVLMLSQLPTAGRGSVVTGWIFVNKREKGGGASVDTG